jgi:asparagine synthase (glutamine-hydrolysing)
MCGIAGWIGPIDEKDKITEKVKKAMLHRGPDAQEHMHWDEITLIHNRLKIIDLTERGTQPMSNEDGTIWIIFNGEIYNHRSLRKELEKKGHMFHSETDTEAIIHLYEEKGNDFVKELHGMFAFCIFDSKKKLVLLARDRYGIKPLFMYQNKGCIAFASELNTLKAIPDIDLSVNLQAIYDYTSLFYIPAPLTFFEHISALVPGEMKVINTRSRNVESVLWHQHEIKPEFSLTEDYVIKETSRLLKNAVESELESDVKLGALLSGGIDSSLVSCYAQKKMSNKLNTFNVKFSDAAYDESWAALLVAEQIGSNHTTLQMPEGSGNWEHLTSLLLHAGQPYADTSYFAMHGVSALMRKHLTVALSGDGGDEGFGGYTFYNEIEQIHWFNQLPKFITCIGVRILGWLSELHPQLKRKHRAIGHFYKASDTKVMENIFCWMREAEHNALWNNRNDLLKVRRYFERDEALLAPLKLNGLEKLSALCTSLNISLVLPNDFLFKVDTASMRESLEIRVPMLNEELFTFGLKLPHALKTKRGELKYILRKIAKSVLPEKVANKPKWGFGIPIDKWVDEDFKEKAYRYLNREDNPVQAYLNKQVYGQWVEAFCKNKTIEGISREGLYQRLIMLLSLSLHLEKTYQD